MGEPEYEPSAWSWVQEQVEAIEAAGDTRAVGIQGMSVVLMTMRGARTGKLRRVPVMRVEHEGAYAAVGSRGGSPQDPHWVNNLRTTPELTLQDGTETFPVVAREIDGDERAAWWERCVAAFPPYAEYAEKTTRTIPVFLLERP